MISRPILLGSTGLALLLSGVAFAMPQVPIIPLDTRPGQTYVTIDAQYSGVPEDDGFAFFEHCPFNGKTTGDALTYSERSRRCDDSEKIALIDALDSIDAYGGGGIIGVTGDHSWFNGDRQRFELGFGILGGDRSEKHTELFEESGPMLTTFEGKGYEPCGESIIESPCGPRHLGIEGRVKSDYDAFNIVARTLIDFEVSPSFTITPNFGLVYRHTENTLHATASWIDPPSYPDAISETSYGGGSHSWLPERNDRIRTNELGVELGTTLSFNLSDAFKLFGGVNGEILYREGRFDRLSNKKHSMSPGCDAPSAPSLAPPIDCTPAIALTAPGFNRHISDSENDTAVNVTLSLGAAYSFPGGTTISVIGYAQNESHLVVTQNSNNNNEPTLTSSGDYHHSNARLDSERDWTPGVVVALTIPFGGG